LLLVKILTVDSNQKEFLIMHSVLIAGGLTPLPIEWRLKHLVHRERRFLRGDMALLAIIGNNIQLVVIHAQAKVQHIFCAFWLMGHFTSTNEQNEGSLSIMISMMNRCKCIVDSTWGGGISTHKPQKVTGIYTL
jgi:hypothetical protein